MGLRGAQTSKERLTTAHGERFQPICHMIVGLADPPSTNDTLHAPRERDVEATHRTGNVGVVEWTLAVRSELRRIARLVPKHPYSFGQQGEKMIDQKAKSPLRFAKRRDVQAQLSRRREPDSAAFSKPRWSFAVPPCSRSMWVTHSASSHADGAASAHGSTKTLRGSLGSAYGSPPGKPKRLHERPRELLGQQ